MPSLTSTLVVILHDKILDLTKASKEHLLLVINTHVNIFEQLLEPVLHLSLLCGVASFGFDHAIVDLVDALDHAALRTINKALGDALHVVKLTLPGGRIALDVVSQLNNVQVASCLLFLESLAHLACEEREEPCFELQEGVIVVVTILCTT